MFYHAAKLIWFLVQPSSLLAISLILAAALWGTKWSRLGWRLLIFGLVGYIVCGLAPVSDALLLPLENRFGRPQLDPGKPIAGVIILGGVEQRPFKPPRELAGLIDTAERITEAVALARRFPEGRIVFAGDTDETASIGLLFEALGVPKERITLVSRSRDTYENALFAKRVINPSVNPSARERWLLITSAWHMPRAVGCFRKVGFPVEPWPVDYRTSGRVEARFHDSIPKGLRQTDIAVREYAGLVAYFLTGRTDALLPAPTSGGVHEHEPGSSRVM
jgi:uncharacterized SAM-binding protein YcdF (DUF218 family)